MINYEENFERLDKAYNKVVVKFYIFKTKPNKYNKEQLLSQIKYFNSIKYQFTMSIKNFYIGEGIDEI